MTPSGHQEEESGAAESTIQDDDDIDLSQLVVTGEGLMTFAEETVKPIMSYVRKEEPSGPLGLLFKELVNNLGILWKIGNSVASREEAEAEKHRQLAERRNSKEPLARDRRLPNEERKDVATHARR